jgi:hypothetical protein
MIFHSLELVLYKSFIKKKLILKTTTKNSYTTRHNHKLNRLASLFSTAYYQRIDMQETETEPDSQIDDCSLSSHVNSS